MHRTTHAAIGAILFTCVAAIPSSGSAQPQDPIEWVEGSSAYDDLHISADGRFLAWTTLDPPVGATTNIALHDRRGDRTTSLTLPMRTTGPVTASLRGITADGTQVLVWTPDALLFDGDPIRCTAPTEDCNFDDDVYLAPVAGGAVTRVSVTPSGDEVLRNDISRAVMSADGTPSGWGGSAPRPPPANPFPHI